MERIIIKIDSEWNGAHASLEGVDYDLAGWAVIPERFQSVWEKHRPFVTIVTNDAGEIVGMSKGDEIFPDIETVRPAKLEELSKACNAAIVDGCDVTLSTGTGHISLTNEDQINLTNAAATVETGIPDYPYHLDGQLCSMYPATDIMRMAQAATAHKLYHTTYYNHLAAWVKRCTTYAEVQSIIYGAELPADLAANMDAILGAMNNG